MIRSQAHSSSMIRSQAHSSSMIGSQAHSSLPQVTGSSCTP
jgi:hypothetical protein